jgi:hypothetical protein
LPRTGAALTEAGLHKVPGRRKAAAASLSEPQESQHEENNDHGSDEPDNAIHRFLSVSNVPYRQMPIDVGLLFFTAGRRGQVSTLGSTVDFSLGCGINFGPQSLSCGAWLARRRAGFFWVFRACNG